ncbi:four helix bundle protein [Flavihumibacter fluvii]|uniref:four helix bundle protein n=1 Tax=Flavihumibacter fluvii TaxID=2838157 RepID=UPI001BDF153E|nr:four helix bundle protein [Flavihumibacter fluvii]ULQ54093.1 four helix bundle protein [Flavihumibacter fluvii]
MKPHQNLEVWKVSFLLVKELYILTAQFPSSEKFGIISQIRRAAVSIPANISEGAGRQSKKEFHHFLTISMGSLSELDTLLMISQSIGYFDEATLIDLSNKLERISRLLHGLLKKVKIESYMR